MISCQSHLCVSKGFKVLPSSMVSTSRLHHLSIQNQATMISATLPFGRRHVICLDARVTSHGRLGHYTRPHCHLKQQFQHLSLSYVVRPSWMNDQKVCSYLPSRTHCSTKGLSFRFSKEDGETYFPFSNLN